MKAFGATININNVKTRDITSDELVFAKAHMILKSFAFYLI